MAVKVNANTVIDNSGNIPWSDLVGKPSGLIETVSITGGGTTFLTVSYNSTTKVLTFVKN